MDGIVRRLIVGVAVGLFMVFMATPAQAAEWCLNDPALIFSSPHAKHNLTVYATEGVQGAEHSYALLKAHVDFTAKPGAGVGAMALDVHTKIEGKDHDSFATVLIVSSQPYGAGAVYGVVVGSNDHDMHVRFTYFYQGGG